MSSFDELNNLTEYAEQNALQTNQSENSAMFANNAATSNTANDTANTTVANENATTNDNANATSNAANVATSNAANVATSNAASTNASKNAAIGAKASKRREDKANASGLKFDKLFKFFSKAGIKKFVLVLYCVVPLLIVSVGFAAWTIIGNDLQSGSGTFNAYGIINSYDYINLETTDIGAIDFYATGFVQEGKVEKTYAFDITYRLNMTMCANLLAEKSTQDTLTAVFEFCFNSGTADYSAFFKNLSCQVVVDKNTTLTVPAQNTNYKTIAGVGTITLKSDSENKGTNNHQLSLYIEPTCAPTKDTIADWSEGTEQKIVELKLTYTLQPSTTFNYQTIYNLVSQLSNEKPMIDVRITD